MFVVALWFVSLSACSRTVFQVPRMRPAEVNLAAHKRLALGGIAGEGGERVVAALTDALVAAQRFEVLDRQHLHAVFKEQDFGTSGRVADDTAISVGQMTGATVLLVGDVVQSVYDEK